MLPDVFVDPESADAGQPVRVVYAAARFGLDRGPGGPPGAAGELLGQCRHGGVVALERVGSPGNGPGGEFRLGPGQGVFLGEDGRWTVGITAPPQSFSP